MPDCDSKFELGSDGLRFLPNDSIYRTAGDREVKIPGIAPLTVPNR